MKKEIKRSLMVLLVLTILTGILYPLGITVIAKIFFPKQAEGSLIVRDGKIVGSELIGQSFDNPKYLWGRLSATTPAYHASASSGSNLGPSNPALIDNAKARINSLKAGDSNNNNPIPVDLVTASGSGLDPHISPAAADYQVSRISKASNLQEGQIRQLIQENTEERTWSILGEPRVNVLKVNLSLNQLYGKK